jgi:hypothetical protein
MTPARVELPGGRAVVPFDDTPGHPVLTVGLPRGDKQAALDLTQPFGSISYQSVGRRASGAVLDFLKFPSVRVGSAIFHNPSFLLEDVPEGQPDWAGVRTLPAVMGVRLFQDVLLTIDGPHRQLVLEKGSLPPPDGAEILPLRTDMMGRPSVQVSVGGRRFWVGLSTAIPDDVHIPDARRKDFPGTGRTIRQDQISLNAGPFYGLLARLDEDFVLGRHVMTRPLVDFGDYGKPALGWGYLRHFAITIDQKNKRVRFARTDRGPIRHQRLVAGFQLDPRTGEVVNVFPGSGAERVGMRRGDRIAAIGGKPWNRLRPAINEFHTVAGGTAVPVIVGREGRLVRLLVPVQEALP